MGQRAWAMAAGENGDSEQTGARGGRGTAGTENQCAAKMTAFGIHPHLYGFYFERKKGPQGPGACTTSAVGEQLQMWPYNAK
jgi:hypothetical protein